MRRRLLLGSLLLALLIGGFLFSRDYDRRRIASWETDWDSTLSWRANQLRRREALHKIAPIAVRVWRKDLNYNSVGANWLEKAPGWFPTDWIPQRSFRSPPAVHAEAAHKLSLLGPDARAALPDLILHCQEENVQVNAALAIGSIGANTPEARSALSKLATNRYNWVACPAAFALWELDPSDLPALQEFEKRLDPNCLISINESLGQMKERGKPVITAFLDAYQHLESFNSKIPVARTLWRVTGDAKEPLALIESFHVEWQEAPGRPAPGAAQSRAINHLTSVALHFGDIPECRVVLRPILNELLKSELTSGRQAAEYALGQLDKIEAEEQLQRTTGLPATH